MSTTDPWYVEAFRADYLDVYPHRDLDSARREVSWLAREVLDGAAPVLDLCCGFGRHTLAMRELGLDVFGVDLSDELLAKAAHLPGRRLEGRLARGDARRVPYLPDVFGAVVVLFSSFGYFGERGDGEFLDGIARVLRPGGTCVLDLMNPSRIRHGLVPESTREVRGARLVERRALEDQGRRVTKEVTLTLPGGDERRWREDVRMYESDEIAGLLAARGMQCADFRGDFDGAPFDRESERQIVLATKSGGSGA